MNETQLEDVRTKLSVHIARIQQRVRELDEEVGERMDDFAEAEMEDRARDGGM